MFGRFRNPDPRPRPAECGFCAAADVTSHCLNAACPWSQCAECKRTTGTVLGQVSVTTGIAMRNPDRGA